MRLTLNQAMIDWFTVGSYEAGFYKYWDQEMSRRTYEENPARIKERKLKRYQGETVPLGSGSLFLGTASQALGFHNVAVATGEAGDLCRLSLWHSLDQYNARCTRIDVQMTVMEPAGWEQLRLLNRIKRDGKLITTYEESRDQKGKVWATVYIGSKKSERFVRVYEKKSDDGRLLRFEGQFGDSQAELLARQLWQRKVTERDVLRGLVGWVADKQLSEIYYPHLAGALVHLPKTYARTDNNTDAWLLDQVLPVLDRRLRSHDCSEVLRDRFKRVVCDNEDC